MFCDMMWINKFEKILVVKKEVKANLLIIHDYAKKHKTMEKENYWDEIGHKNVSSGIFIFNLKIRKKLEIIYKISSILQYLI